MKNINKFWINHQIYDLEKEYKGEKTIKHILNDGYLRPSYITKNYRLCGDDDYDNHKESTKYIYTRLNNRITDKNDTFILNPSFLLEQKFWLNNGWFGGRDKSSIEIDGTKLTLDELYDIFIKFRKSIFEKRKETRKKYPGRIMHPMKNEIIFKKPVDLKRFLLKVNVFPDTFSKEEIHKYKLKYPNVIISN